MTAEVIDLNQRRQERWIRQLELARATGQVAIFGSSIEHINNVVPFPIDKIKAEEE